MTKDEIVEILKAHGYPAENEDGVVYVRKALTKSEVREMTRILRNEEYSGRYGFRRKAEPNSKKT